MSEMIAFFILFAEILMTLQWLHIVFGQKLRLGKIAVGIIILDFCVYMGINFNILPMICSVFIYVLLALYCYYVFKRTIPQTFVGMIIGFSVVVCIEAGVGAIVRVFIGTNDFVFEPLISSLCALILTYLIKKYIPILKSAWCSIRNNGIFGIAIVSGLIILSFILDYYLYNRAVNSYKIIIFTFIVFIFFYLYRLEQAQSEIEKKNYELEMQRVYGGTYEKLLAEVRRKQHDYKNQLGAIYSMHLVANSLDELVNMQKEYSNNLQSDCKFDSILTCCDNSILAGYIYYKCIACEKEGIVVDYDIKLEQASCCFALHEIIEILGILIDNACENFATEQNTGKQIELKFQEDEEEIVFSVSNPAKYASFSDIEKMFTQGYSSKGKNRGIGLARVLELMKKYGAEVKVFNSSKDEMNWINFTIEIAK